MSWLDRHICDRNVSVLRISIYYNYEGGTGEDILKRSQGGRGRCRDRREPGAKRGGTRYR